MRAHLPSYEMKAPATLSETLSLLKTEPGVWRPFAGGTDLMVLFESGKLAHRKFLSLWHLQELKGIAESASHLTLGALTTYSEIQAHPVLKNEFPLLCRAAFETGAIAIQNRGTLGGNIANASPAADSPPALLVYEAELELVSAENSRWVPYLGFHTGYKSTIMRPGELIRRVRLPRTAALSDWHSYYRKAGTRKAQAISKVCFAGLARFRDVEPGLAGNEPGLASNEALAEVRICLGSVAPTAVRLPMTEALLSGQIVTPELIVRAQTALRSEIKPIGDIRSTADFRLRVSTNLLEEFLLGLGSRAGARP